MIVVGILDRRAFLRGGQPSSRPLPGPPSSAGAAFFAGAAFVRRRGFFGRCRRPSSPARPSSRRGLLRRAPSSARGLRRGAAFAARSLLRGGLRGRGLRRAAAFCRRSLLRGCGCLGGGRGLLRCGASLPSRWGCLPRVDPRQGPVSSLRLGNGPRFALIVPCPGTCHPRGRARAVVRCEQGPSLPHRTIQRTSVCLTGSATGNGPRPSTMNVADQVVVQAHPVGARPPVGVRDPQVRVAPARIEVSSADAVAEHHGHAGVARQRDVRPSRSTRHVRAPAGWPESNTTGIWVRIPSRAGTRAAAQVFPARSLPAHRAPDLGDGHRPTRRHAHQAQLPPGCPSGLEPRAQEASARAAAHDAEARRLPVEGVARARDRAGSRQPPSAARAGRTSRRVSASTVVGRSRPPVPT